MQKKKNLTVFDSKSVAISSINLALKNPEKSKMVVYHKTFHGGRDVALIFPFSNVIGYNASTKKPCGDLKMVFKEYDGLVTAYPV